MRKINNNDDPFKTGYGIHAVSDDTQVLNTRVYNPIGRFRFFYYITQLLAHCLLIGVLINVWSKPYVFFLWHPTLACFGLYFYIQGVLQVQWTESNSRRLKGARIHSIFNGLGTLFIMIAFIIVEVNKNRLGATHFTSPHGQLGLSIFVLIWVAALAGALSLYIPGVFGGLAKAKKVYTPHRVLGYWIVIFMLVNVCLGIFTSWGLSNFKLHWVIIACVATLLTSLILTLDIRKVRF